LDRVRIKQTFDLYLRLGAVKAIAPPKIAAAHTDDARARLLQAGLRLFAQQGYNKTSTRELAQAAQVNVAAISYYFADKAGLYRAVFFEPLGEPVDPIAAIAAPGQALLTSLCRFFESFLEPLRHGEAARLCIKLRFREMLEPTGLWDEEIALGIKPLHDAMVALLVRHLGLEAPDLELHRLVISLSGLGVHVHVGRDIADQLAPGLNSQNDSVDVWVERLSGYAMAMVQAEAARRGLRLKEIAA
jgi:AcrR family transcriptional regulator